MRKKTALVTVILILSYLIGCSGNNSGITIAFNISPTLSLTYSGDMSGSLVVFENEKKTVDQKLDYDLNLKLTITDNPDDTTAHCLAFVLNSQIDTTIFDYYLNKSGNISNFEIQNNKADSQLTFDHLNFPTFPDHPISIGEIWTNSSKTFLGNDSVEITTEYKFVGTIKKDTYYCAHITYEGRTEIPIKNQSENDTYRNGKDNLLISGELYFAIDEGFIIYQSEKNQISRMLKEMRGRNLISKYRLNYYLESEMKLVHAATDIF